LLRDKITPEVVYTYYRKAQSIAKNRPYRLPKNFEKHLNEKMSEDNRGLLLLTTKFFNTKWKDVDPYRFFECGFELFKSFTYNKFKDPRVIKLYIQKDKNIKRKAEFTKETLIESAKFVKQYSYMPFNIYCMSRENNRLLIINHYLLNKIDHYFLTWLIYDKMVFLSDDDRAAIPYIEENYRKTIEELENVRPFLSRLKERL
jgi:hypothetical protein